jgi:UDP-glucose 4-epimerase
MIPIPEEHPMAPINPYGETKAAVERMLPWYEKQFGLRSVSLRYFNAAGATERQGGPPPGDPPDPERAQVALGQRPAISCTATITRRAMAPACATTSRFRPGGGACWRWTGQMRRARSTTPGSGLGFTNREVIEAARTVTGEPIPVHEEPRRQAIRRTRRVAGQDPCGAWLVAGARTSRTSSKRRGAGTASTRRVRGIGA